MKLYAVSESREWEWSVMVAAHTMKEAKKIGYREIVSLVSKHDIDYLQVRVRRIENIEVPETILMPTAYVTCEDAAWLCGAWNQDECCCNPCERKNV